MFTQVSKTDDKSGVITRNYRVRTRDNKTGFVLKNINAISFQQGWVKVFSEDCLVYAVPELSVLEIKNVTEKCID